MNEDQLIKALRRHRPSPPPAPLGEWESIAQRSTQAGATRLRRWGLALASGLVVAALLTLPRQHPQPWLGDEAEIEELLQDAAKAQAPAKAQATDEWDDLT